MTIFLPSGEKHTQHIVLEWPFKVSPILTAVLASQIIAILSLLPVTIRFPSGEKLTQLTPSEWPFKGSPIITLVFTSHIIARKS